MTNETIANADQLELDIFFSGYQEFVQSIGARHKTPEEDYLHGAIGVSKEAGELLDNAYRYWNYKKPRTSETDENVLEEAGDILYYLQLMLNQVGHHIGDAMVHNFKKLNKRYPNGFTHEAALARADKKEGE